MIGHDPSFPYEASMNAGAAPPTDPWWKPAIRGDDSPAISMIGHFSRAGMGVARHSSAVCRYDAFVHVTSIPATRTTAQNNVETP
jgi:hypothetical protein